MKPRSELSGVRASLILLQRGKLARLYLICVVGGLYCFDCGGERCDCDKRAKNCTPGGHPVGGVRAIGEGLHDVRVHAELVAGGGRSVSKAGPTTRGGGGRRARTISMAGDADHVGRIGEGPRLRVSNTCSSVAMSGGRKGKF